LGKIPQFNYGEFIFKTLTLLCKNNGEMLGECD
jgi:hypothetical protein